MAPSSSSINQSASISSSDMTSAALDLNLLPPGAAAFAAAANPANPFRSPLTSSFRTFSSSAVTSSATGGKVTELSSDEAFESALAATKVSSSSSSPPSSSSSSSSSSASSPLAVLQFTAAWCGPCRAVAPLLDQMAAASDPRRVAFYKIDVDNDSVSKSCGDQNIAAVPTFKFVKDGAVVEEATVRGADVAALKAAIEELAPH